MIYFCAVLVLFAAIMLLTSTKAVSVNDTEQLSGFDFVSDIAYISADCFTWYPDAHG